MRRTLAAMLGFLIGAAVTGIGVEAGILIPRRALESAPAETPATLSTPAVVSIAEPEGTWEGRCLRAKDGDTYVLDLHRGDVTLTDVTVRLAGFDAYETSDGGYSTAETIVRGDYARETAEGYLACTEAAILEHTEPAYPLEVVLHGADSFGRWLADVTTTTGESLADVLADGCYGGEWVPGRDNPPIPPAHCPVLVPAAEGR